MQGMRDVASARLWSFVVPQAALRYGCLQGVFLPQMLALGLPRPAGGGFKALSARLVYASDNLNYAKYGVRSMEYGVCGFGATALLLGVLLLLLLLVLSATVLVLVLVGHPV